MMKHKHEATASTEPVTNNAKASGTMGLRPWNRSYALALLAAVIPCATGKAIAQTQSVSYSFAHNFAFYPGFWPALGTPAFWFVPVGIGSASSYSYASTPGFAPHSQSASQSSWVPPLPSVGTSTAAQSGPSHSASQSSVTASIGPFGVVTGLLSTAGNAVAVGPGAQAAAAGSASYTAIGLGWSRGWLNWRPTLVSHVSGGASVSNPWRGRDPVEYSIDGPSGTVLEKGSFLSIDLDAAGDAALQWTGTTLSVAPDATALLDIRLGDLDNGVADYVPNSMEGHLRLRLENGLVTEASKVGSGLWLADWVLPPVGTPFSGIIPTSNGFEFGWDFGRDVDAELNLFTSVPEPGEYAGMAAACLAGYALVRRRRPQVSQRMG